MTTIVIIPGGFHPFHEGHYSLYKSAMKKFPNSDIYFAATDNRKTRPFPFEIKKKLAKVFGVPEDKFVQVKNPFVPTEITGKYDSNNDIVIFIRSEKDRKEQPQPGGTKKDGSPNYFQAYGKNMLPFGKHAYMDYLPTIEFGPGIQSASQIRELWPTLNAKQKQAMVISLYPHSKNNTKLIPILVKLLDTGMQNSVQEAKNPAQQAAIAISMKKAGKKPKTNESVDYLPEK